MFADGLPIAHPHGIDVHMPTAPDHANPTAAIRISGDVRAIEFPAWILRHAAKLGLCAVSVTDQKNSLSVQATGPGDMLHALALACSLGCASVLVDEVEFTLVAE